MTRQEYLDRMVPAYIECALWASTDDDGEPLDENLSSDDFTRKAAAEMRRDCREFLRLAWGALEYWTPEQAGHDFWLTRNGHGAGFWDRGLPNEELLSSIARTFGECYLYVSRGRIHIA